MAPDDAESRNTSAPFSDEPSEPDPSLWWWTGWAPPSSALQQMLVGPPGLTLPGDIEEVRIRRSGPNGTFMIQIGFRPSGGTYDA